ncbi:hypothetical protein GW17_00023260, partial [Ensete ventricosum]
QRGGGHPPVGRSPAKGATLQPGPLQGRLVVARLPVGMVDYDQASYRGGRMRPGYL